MNKVLPLLMLAAIACASKMSEEPSDVSDVSSVQKPKVLFVIAHKDFRDEELTVPSGILEEGGFEIEIASTDTTTARGMLGTEVKPDILITEAESDNYRALVIVGGAGCKNLWDNEDLIGLVKDVADQGKIVAAICLAPVVLANAGMLEGIEATCFSSVREELEEGGARYKNQDVVTSGKIVTASGPKAAEEFGKKLLSLLEE